MNEPIDICIKNGNDSQFCENVCKDVKINSIVQGNSLDLMKCLASKSVDLIVTSPPYAEARKKQYGGINPDKYVEWFIPFADEMFRILKDDGSFVLNIKDKVVNGERHTYVFELANELKKRGWKFVDTYIWVKTKTMPIKPINRFRDSFEYVFHFAKSTKPKFIPNAVKVPAKPSTAKRYLRPRDNDNKHYISQTGSGFVFNREKYKNSKFYKEGFAYPTNVIAISTETSNKKHPAVFPEKLPAFFIDLMSDRGDLVLDPFIGSGTTAKVAKEKCRNFLGFDLKREYIDIANERVAEVNPKCDT